MIYLVKKMNKLFIHSFLIKLFIKITDFQMLKIIVFLSLLFLTDSCRVLVLSGGGGHCACQPGLISGLIQDNPNLSWDVITGISAGSINAYYLSTRRLENSLYEVVTNLSKFWQDTKTKDIYSINLLWKESIFDTTPLHYYLKQHINESVGFTPVYVGAVSLETGNLNISYSTPENLTDHFVVESIMSSTAIPILFPPHSFGGQHWIDGGIIADEIINEGIKWCDGSDEIIVDIMINAPTLIDTVNVSMNIFDIALRTLGIIMDKFDHYEFYNTYPVRCQTLTINIYTPPEPIPYFMLNFDHGPEIWKMCYMNHQPNQTYTLPCYGKN